MAVRRIVADFASADPQASRTFYEGLLGLKVTMDQGWIITFESDQLAPPQLSVASQGGSGTPVPDLSIEVEDIDNVYQRMRDTGCEIVYEIVNQPWGVRRFFVRDPSNRIINILMHEPD